jgi:4-diphosphocytidyl-2-C-methyl-D-erythritol kinase
MYFMRIIAPAKINLHLAVLDRRPDGFHNLESLFLALDFGDILHFEPFYAGKTTEITMEGYAAAGFDLSPEKNIVFKALSLFREKTGFNQSLKIKVEKHIPMGGGLGGGSSDAASTLLALNKIAGSPLSRENLLEMAATLGSDVPFFIYETPAAKITGRGEQIEPVEPPRWFIVLVNPGFHSDTETAFRLLDEYRAKNPAEVSVSASLINKNSYCGDNDFLPVFEEKEKAVYNGIISQLQRLGACFAGLSGAGSTCFGLFKEKDQAVFSAKVLSGKWGFVRVALVAKFPIPLEYLNSHSE